MNVYEPLRRQIEDMERKIRDMMDRPGDGAAGRLLSEIRLLESDLQTGKNARSMEDRVKRIIHILEGEAKKDRIMNYEHLDMFKRWFEHFRETIRRYE